MRVEVFYDTLCIPGRTETCDVFHTRKRAEEMAHMVSKTAPGSVPILLKCPKCDKYLGTASVLD